MQLAKQWGATLEFHPMYTAYAFKWNTDRRRQKWDEPTVRRLDAKTLAIGDDVFKTIYARGVPSRVVSTNDFELLGLPVRSGAADEGQRLRLPTELRGMLGAP